MQKIAVFIPQIMYICIESYGLLVMEQLFELYTSKLAETSVGFVRYLHDRIDWNSRLVVIVGARGVGKTTMLLQHIRLTCAEKESLYIAADNTYFSSNTLFDTATAFSRGGGKILYIDEAHKYPDWSREIKMMYDYLPDLKIVVTGSSVLDIRKGVDADLSRRAITYAMEGLSFREFLNFRLGTDIRPFSLEEIIAGNAVLPEQIKYPLMHFREYLSKGYFPFSAQDNYLMRLENVINHTLEIDIPFFANMSAATVRKLKKLLYVVSRSVPFKPNFSEIGRALSIDRGTVADYMVYLEKAGLTRQLNISGGGMSVVEKVEKIYLANTNFIYALSDGHPDIGNIRETFFISAMVVNHKVAASPVSDFLVDGYTFEVGGRGKSGKQLRGTDDAFVVKDDIEHAYMNIIPLWAFGLNY